MHIQHRALSSLQQGSDRVLRIVDLAGSERASRTNASGERTQEAGAINTDLMYLMICLRSLVEQQSKQNQKMMYRNCKLTHLLSVPLHSGSDG